MPEAQAPALAYLESLSEREAKRTRSLLNELTDYASNGRAGLSTFRWDKLDRMAVESIKSWVSEKHSPSKAQRMLTAVRRVLMKCVEMGMMSGATYEAVLGLAPGGIDSLSAVEQLRRQDINTMFEVCARGRLGVTRSRDAALVALLYGFGVGEEQAASLDLADYYEIVGDHEAPENAAGAIESWILQRGSEDGPLLYTIGQGGQIVRRRMSKETIYCVLKRLGRKIAPTLQERAQVGTKTSSRAPRGGIQPCPSCGGFVWGCLRCGQAECLPGKDVARRKAERSVRGIASSGRTLTQEELLALVYGCTSDATPAGARDAAIIGLLCSGGLNRSEVVDLELRHWRSRPPKIVLKARTNRPSREVLLDDVAASLMGRWLPVRGLRPGPLFQNLTTGKRLGARSITAMLRKRSWDTGIDPVGIGDLHNTMLNSLLAAGTQGNLKRYGRGIPSTIPNVLGVTKATTSVPPEDPRLRWLDALATPELESLGVRIDLILSGRNKNLR